MKGVTSLPMLPMLPLLALLLAPDASGQEVPRPDLTEAEPAVRSRLEALASRIALDPGDGRAWGRYATALDAHEFTEDATAAYRIAHRLDPRELRWPYLLATLLELSDPPAALPYYEKALAIDDSYAPAHIRIAETLERLARDDEAAEHYRRAVALDPGNPFGSFGLGRLALARGDLPEAVRQLEHARALDPGIKAINSSLAQALFRIGETERARDLVDEAKDLPRNTYHPDPIRAAVKDEGSDVRSILARSKTYRDTGQLETALGEARRAVDVAPDFASAHFTVAELLLLLDRREEAVAPALRAAELEPRFLLVPPFLAQLFFQLQRFDEADRWAQRALELHTEDAGMHLLLSMTAAERGDVAAVVEHLDEAYGLRPRDRATRLLLRRLLIDLADALAGAGAPGPAAARLEKALALATEDGDHGPDVEELRRHLDAYRTAAAHGG